jgi:hypothetical protein
MIKGQTMHDTTLRGALGWLDDLIAGRVPKLIPNVAKLRQYRAAIERDLAVRAQLRAEVGRPMVTINGDTFPVLGADQFDDVQVAGMVRMLMRDDPQHELVCSMGRDRILHLSQRLAAMVMKNKAAEEARIIDGALAKEMANG